MTDSERPNALPASKFKTWYCPRGCNIFNSSIYDCEEPPECAACGCHMSINSDGYDHVHTEIEAIQISEFEAKTRANEK